MEAGALEMPTRWQSLLVKSSLWVSFPHLSVGSHEVSPYKGILRVCGVLWASHFATLLMAGWSPRIVR